MVHAGSGSPVGSAPPTPPTPPLSPSLTQVWESPSTEKPVLEPLFAAGFHGIELAFLLLAEFVRDGRRWAGGSGRRPGAAPAAAAKREEAMNRRGVRRSVSQHRCRQRVGPPMQLLADLTQRPWLHHTAGMCPSVHVSSWSPTTLLLRRGAAASCCCGQCMEELCREELCREELCGCLGRALARPGPTPFHHIPAAEDSSPLLIGPCLRLSAVPPADRGGGCRA